MKKWWSGYFSLSKREYNGMLVLMTIVLLISILPYIYEHWFLKKTAVTPEEQAAISGLEIIQLEHEARTNAFTNVETKGKLTRAARLFRFDPNKIGLTDWQKLGLSARQAQSVLNYRSKGGKFYKTEDLQKMYAISPKKYLELAPYVDIAPAAKTKDLAFLPDKKELPVIEINAADTLQLDQIKGIGAAFARRIVSYRNRLGGFHKKEQLMEVFGLDSLKFEEMKPQIALDVTAVRKINLNTATFETLKGHPYLTFKQINAVLQYRKQHGEFQTIDDLKKVVILTPQNIQNLSPYLIFK